MLTLDGVVDILSSYIARRNMPKTDAEVRDQIEELKECIEVLTAERAELGKRLPVYSGLPRNGK